MTEPLLTYVPPDGLLQDRVILVTGAAMGIGRAAALAYARFGATVVLLDKQVALMEQVYDEIEAMGAPRAAIYPLDMQGASATDYEAMADNLQAQLGRLDGVLLNAAWLAAFMSVRQHGVELWFKMLNVNLHANFMLVRACLPLLETAPDPAIVFSTEASGKPLQGAFGVAKAGMDAFCQTLAQEHDDGRHFMRVNRIDTGPVRTSTRVMNFPGEDPDTLVRPAAVVGPYLFYMGPEAARRTNELCQWGRLPMDFVWPGEGRP
ncbi:MAG: SDR family NAD(P)-dependent oxidoreductase [Thiothrix sp.]|nr:SDR family NAD(P)-dependent oxidoreductase [Thiothrix sp.]HPE61156.1 SDR family NAD(P)-dependent oxidoreductase [Thiolinea sp.]